MAILPGDPANSDDQPLCGDAAVNGNLPVGLPRLLFLGTYATAKSLARILQEGQAQGAAAWELAAFTSQKSALQSIRLTPPQVVMVQVDATPAGRLRFYEMVRYRLPTGVIVALGETRPVQATHWAGYLALPVVAEELWTLLAEIGSANGEPVLQHGPIRLNVVTRTVSSTNGQHHMTPKQCALLHLLMTRPGVVVSRSEIMAAIWDTSYMEDTRTLDVHIRWLRERIEPDPSNPVYLLTVRGQGYRLAVAEKSSR